MLKELIDKFYLDREREKEDKERTRFYISESGKCSRAIFFRFKRAPKKELEAERLRVFEFGNHIQQIVLRPLVSLGLVETTEVPIPPHQIISGRADIILKVGGERYVVDVKSISGRMNLTKMERPMPEHYEQVQLYLHFFKIKKGILLYVNKDTQELKDFVFDYDGYLIEKLLKRFENLKLKIESNIIPNRLSDYPINWQCQNCEYREICDIVSAGEINWDDFKKKIETQTSE
ncbi:MAG: PD-(D/E)XK nuclease family protein [Patescibacteria group bacterium]|nr:PD-(D/E)XK nuclease family protein [Patescibacteria group bacterium]